MTGGNAPKRKGDQWERDVVAYLIGQGYGYAERTYGAGRPDDKGDIDGLPGWIIQCKNERTMDLSGALDSAHLQARGRIAYCCAIFKRRNRPTSQAYVVMSLETFAAIAGDRQPTEGPPYD